MDIVVLRIDLGGNVCRLGQRIVVRQPEMNSTGLEHGEGN